MALAFCRACVRGKLLPTRPAAPGSVLQAPAASGKSCLSSLLPSIRHLVKGFTGWRKSNVVPVVDKKLKGPSEKTEARWNHFSPRENQKSFQNIFLGTCRRRVRRARMEYTEENTTSPKESCDSSSSDMPGCKDTKIKPLEDDSESKFSSRELLALDNPEEDRKRTRGVLELLTHQVSQEETSPGVLTSFS